MEQKTGKKSSLKLSEGIKILFANKYWFIMLMVNIFYTAMTSLYGMNMYFAKYVMQDAGYNKTMMMCSTFASILVPLLLIPIVQRIGKTKCGSVRRCRNGYCRTARPDLICGETMGIMYLGLILRGMGVACISATKFGMIADSIEYGEYKTGTRAEGFVYSAASLGVRVGSALASAVIGWVLRRLRL